MIGIAVTNERPGFTLTPLIENSNIKIAKITKHIQIVDESKFLIFVMIKNPLCYITNILLVVHQLILQINIFF